MTPAESGGRTPVTETRADYRHWLRIPTRWMDNDTYGHVNNVTYYSYFDSLINEHLIASGGLDIHDGRIVGMVAETGCRFLSELSFPDVIDGGLRVAHLGRSSVRYEIGLFKEGDDEPSAVGHFVHVFVSRETRRPVEMPESIRSCLEPLLVASLS